MGIVTMGPPTELVLFLRDKFGIRSFVETGTYQGTTAFWASGLFDSVHTIELSEELRQTAQARFGHARNIEFVAGDSREQLSNICHEVPGPILFWLDAHYSAGITAGGGEMAPVLGEIEIIDRHMPDAVIMIDDARLFERPPPEPHALDEYPSLNQTLEALNAHVPRYVAIVDDVIVAVPEVCAGQVRRFLQLQATRESRLHSEESRKGHYRKALDHFAQGLRASLRGLMRSLAGVRKGLWSR